MKRFASLIAAGVALLIVVGAAVYMQRRPIVLGTSPGGSVLQFMVDYETIRRSGRPVVIDGICISACTFVVGMIEPERVCVTPFAKLAFHSASTYGFMGRAHSAEGTRLVWQLYPEHVREMLRRKGWDGDPPGLPKAHEEPKPAPKRGPAPKPPTNEHDELIYIDGDELLSIFRAC